MGRASGTEGRGNLRGSVGMKRGHGDKLARKQEQAIIALLEQATLGQAAAVGVNEKTLRAWLKLPAFQSEYRAARRQIVEAAITRLQQLTTGAVLALNRNLSCGNPSVEVRASQIILEQSLQAVELGEVPQRVEDLEQQLVGSTTKRPPPFDCGETAGPVGGT